jgi:subtilisin family serine protease
MKSLFFSSRKISGFVLGLLVLGFTFGCQKDIIETGNTDGSGADAVTLKSAKINDLMVITKAETLPSGFETKLSAYGQIVNTIPEIGVVIIKPTVSNCETKIARLEEVRAVVPDLKIKWIEPDYFVGEANPPSIGTNETYFKYQWGMDAIDAPEAWNAGYKGSNARVFILDTGIDAENPDLAPNLNTALCASFVPGEDYDIDEYNQDGDAVYFNHGTHVAGIIAAADNSYGVIGVAPYAEIVAVKVLSEYSGSGAFSWINAGIVYAANNGADVINMSLGATFDRNGFYVEDGVLYKIPASYIQNFILAQQRAVNYAFKQGVLIVTSAGNGGSNFDGNASIFKLPAELQNVIAVSATAPYSWYYYYYYNLPTNLDIPASYIDYGKSLVEIAAPGGDFDSPASYYAYDMVLSTCPGPSYFFAAGTSMASPHVAGVAALIIGKNGGTMSPQEVTKQLFKTADKIDGQGISAYFGYGRVNAFRAVTE